jgi:hypothetical protein
MENVILGKDFNFGTTGSLFHAFTQKACGLTQVTFDS